MGRLKQRSRCLARHTSVLDSFKPYPGTRAPPPIGWAKKVIIHMTRLSSGEVSAPQICHLIVSSCFHEVIYAHEYVCASWSKQTVTSLGTTHDLSSTDDGILHS
jgi:hypothetical protein